jgi:hypothetical protein
MSYEFNSFDIIRHTFSRYSLCLYLSSATFGKDRTMSQKVKLTISNWSLWLVPSTPFTTKNSSRYVEKSKYLCNLWR